MPHLVRKVHDGPLAVGSSVYGEEVIVVSLAGELEGGNVATAREVLAAAIGEYTMVVVDLAPLEALDREGAELVAAIADGDGGGAELRFLPSRSAAVSAALAAADGEAKVKFVSVPDGDGDGRRDGGAGHDEPSGQTR